MAFDHALLLRATALVLFELPVKNFKTYLQVAINEKFNYEMFCTFVKSIC